jgi:hypothetical protein
MYIRQERSQILSSLLEMAPELIASQFVGKLAEAEKIDRYERRTNSRKRRLLRALTVKRE